MSSTLPQKVLCQLATEEDDASAQALMKCMGVPAREYHLRVLKKVYCFFTAFWSYLHASVLNLISPVCCDLKCVIPCILDCDAAARKPREELRLPGQHKSEVIVKRNWTHKNKD